jgi:hypothetical protein
MATHERVPFRLIQTPCCNTLLCWVNPRLPSHCPECGTFIYPQVRGGILVTDENAQLSYTIPISGVLNLFAERKEKTEP